MGGEARLVNYGQDGHCDDGGDGSDYAACPFGTDCADCGGRNLVGCTYDCINADSAIGAADACSTLVDDEGHTLHMDAAAGYTGCFLSQWDLSDPSHSASFPYGEQQWACGVPLPVAAAAQRPTVPAL